ncbi:MAG: dTDP-4-dehydrorhamnose 3,5-epimerase [Candidatus Shapirobacteria bacterium]|jgi:dTDP-4-dehydrorhamnose 3,5-epimerase
MAREVVTRGGVFRFSEKIEDVVLYKPNVYRDDRGLFLETYNAELFKSVGITAHFCQSNQSVSKPGVTRALHIQLPPYAQAKLVGVSMGQVFDVVVDVRTDSDPIIFETFELSEENRFQVFMPRGCLHGFQVMGELPAIFSYQVDSIYDGASSRGVMYNDPRIGVPWPISQPELSPQDKAWPTLEAALPQLRNLQW